MSKSQKDVKQSNKQTMEEVHKKINSHNEVQHNVNFDVKYEGVQKHLLAHFEGFWSPSYVIKIDQYEPLNLFFCEPPP